MYLNVCVNHHLSQFFHINISDINIPKIYINIKVSIKIIFKIREENILFIYFNIFIKFILYVMKYARFFENSI